jgi:hypothetical protein
MRLREQDGTAPRVLPVRTPLRVPRCCPRAPWHAGRARSVAARLLTVASLGRAFQVSPGAANRRPALSDRGDSAACRSRRTAVHALADAGDNMRSPASRIEASGQGAAAEAGRAEAGRAEGEGEVLTADELNVADVSINPLKYKSVVAEPRGKHGMWKSHLSHVLDGLSALFSLACGSATLACMGILEWRSVPCATYRCPAHLMAMLLCCLRTSPSLLPPFHLTSVVHVLCSTLATVVAFVGYLSTAVGSVMVLATAVVGVLALFDALRTPGPGPQGEKSALDDGSLQALAAPPRRLGSMKGRLGSTGGGRIGSAGSRIQ